MPRSKLLLLLVRWWLHNTEKSTCILPSDTATTVCLIWHIQVVRLLCVHNEGNTDWMNLSWFQMDRKQHSRIEWLFWKLYVAWNREPYNYTNHLIICKIDYLHKGGQRLHSTTQTKKTWSAKSVKYEDMCLSNIHDIFTDRVGAKNYLIQNIQKIGQLNRLKGMEYLCQIYGNSLCIP